MKNFERAIKKLLEEEFNQPLSSRTTKRIIRFFFENLYDSLVETGKFNFPKGFGSLRVKDLKPFEKTQKDGTLVVVKGRRVIRYFAGHTVKRRVQNGR